LNILVIGSGGREHALAEAFVRSPQVTRVVVSPGNAGIALKYPTVELASHQSILDYCHESLIDMVFIGPETAIADGLSDYLRAGGIKVIAPSQKAGRIETSKIFAKELMQRYQIPTAKHVSVSDYESALERLDMFTLPVVIKADGLAAGKGVVICFTKADAIKELSALLVDKSLGEAGSRVIIEEYLEGWEVSLFAITDGDSFCTTIFAQDHKQLYNDDKGPNTGGMGAYAPVPAAEEYRKEIEDSIIAPILAALKMEDSLYQGILFCGIMITPQGPKVIEFNCRLGDPETQAILPLLETDLVQICDAIEQHKVSALQVAWKTDTSVCVVLTSEGYPRKPNTGHPIFIPSITSATVYYAGVCDINGILCNCGGRVLNVVGIADDIDTARAMAYNEIKGIEFYGKYYRNDIGLRINKFKQ